MVEMALSLHLDIHVVIHEMIRDKSPLLKDSTCLQAKDMLL